MAMYKNPELLKHNQSNVFDILHGARASTPFSGIYRCDGCGYETVSTENHPLPFLHHRLHPQNTPIQWRLVVVAQIHD